ncbi:alpha/beta fold hydrolase [Virgibacillus sp. YIM 98842]|jgi:carboxylesterase|uniref:alpha/beta hydrolase n=1 Tax=Virgibacillus sp. YIM 98842 TaxID=2663533 RepID=UPI0013DA6A5E|nr:alpha/beta fold hydrolase [Virgibacillus sp. YIM 98842]
MKVKKPAPFTFEAGPRAVLLLHGYTGNSADVRMLGRYLEKKGYTSHAPIYRGHDQPPEELIRATPEEWWEDVQGAYKYLQELGYKEIAVAGLSLGGVLGLKLAYSQKTKAVIPMCSPMFFDNETQLTHGYKEYAKEYKKLEGKEAAQINEEVDELMRNSSASFSRLGSFIESVKKNIDTIYTPTMVIQAKQDNMINTDSANYIYDHVETDHKSIRWYEEAGHVITLSKEKDQLHEDVYEFLEGLDWEE